MFTHQTDGWKNKRSGEFHSFFFFFFPSQKLPDFRCSSVPTGTRRRRTPNLAEVLGGHAVVLPAGQAMDVRQHLVFGLDELGFVGTVRNDAHFIIIIIIKKKKRGTLWMRHTVQRTFASDLFGFF